MSLHEECPECFSEHLRVCVCKHRLNRQECYECGWTGEPFVPEQRVVRTSRDILVDRGCCYELFDKYGHPILLSGVFPSEADARKQAEKDVAHGRTDEDAGPYKAVVWPRSVKVKGELVQ